ncbi:MAG: hypothetical protein ISS89_01685 [Candidatus Omnitrophica bacterium]|nr:hypothetical protein [Candidatus Omnitrophota bacterium]
MNKKGIALIAAIMLIIFTSIAVLGVSTFIVQRLQQNEVESRRIRAIYLAQAGIHRAIHDYRSGGAVTLGQTTVAAGRTFSLGGNETDLFLADAESVKVKQESLEIDVKDVTSSEDLTIDRITISWSAASADEKLIEIQISGTSVWSNPSGITSGTQADITDYLLDTTDFKTVEFTFEGPAGGGKGKGKPTIDMRDKENFTLTFELVASPANLTKTVIYYKNPDASHRNFAKFSLKSTGEDNSIWRTLYVDYDVSAAATSFITSWKEIDEKIP